jgi:hypothetical protein
MTIGLLAISDGRHEYHHRSLQSALEHLPRFDQYVFVEDPDHTLGFSGAIQRGWDRVKTDWIVHWECDFIAYSEVPVRKMIDLLRRNPRLAQVCLKRQAVNEQEKAAGGIVEAHPDWFTERHDRPYTYTENTVCFSTNPSVYSSRIAQRWPQAKNSEGVFTHQLLADGFRFAFWGGKFDPPLVEHIGHTRNGTGY